ncbi:MAG: AmpG family muropeptide MFS transporter [Rickettsiales bacterium]|jgi:PAT family beta-lactamase induction signal transducer AmpG|nr:AmpG family muropeptide MFS transporter [Rickettsiales bacterium]
MALIRLYARPRLVAVLLLGFASGLPLALTASTLSVWLTESGVSKAAIGLFAAVGTPYALKFLWAPLVDGLRLPFFCRVFGRRRGWLLATQCLLAAALVMLGLADPAIDPWLTALAAMCVASLSATQDIVIDAYRVELLKEEEQGAGAAAVVLGYRFGMIASSAGALFLATWFGWQVTYVLMASLLAVGALAALMAGEPTQVSGFRVQGSERKKLSQWLQDHVVTPFAEFMQRPQWLAILLFIVLYKLADAFMGVMTNPFLIEIGFSKEQIATIVKLYGLIATIAGSFIGGWMVYKLGIMRSLWICGIGHGVTNFMFVVQAYAGADEAVLALSITLENVTGGMGTAAFVAYISRLTNVAFTATQYALLSSLAAFGRTWLSTPAGWVAEQLGWPLFFAFAAALAIPGLVVLWWMSYSSRKF